ncbi:MAG: aspartate kinase [Pseudomonadales bacterium]|jgi:aspartate kinase|nr:aspartate kinase [Pseudomonadales bacterium]
MNVKDETQVRLAASSLPGHTVEKIGGTSMARVDTVLDSVLVGSREGEELYNRIFVVSAYGGMTDLLLEHKKSGDAGVYALFSEGEESDAWNGALTRVGERMCEKNAEIFEDDVWRQAADQFIRERVEGTRSCLEDLQRLCSYGHFQLEQHLLTVREMLAAIGEAHSAFNTVLLLKSRGVNARFVDLTGWREDELAPLDERIRAAFDGLEPQHELLIVPGYAKCEEGLVRLYDRGYSEITMSRIAVITGAREAVIHKEYHLSSADPKVVGADRVAPIGRTNYDVADQLSNIGMEAIHPRAAKGLRQQGIPLRVRNTFEPEHAGTLIDSEYRSDEPCVEIVAGCREVLAVEVFDQDMVGASGYDQEILALLARFRIDVVGKDVNANTITHYVDSSLKKVKRLSRFVEERYPSALVKVRRVAIVSAIGSDLDVPGLLGHCVGELARAGINILALHQNMRAVDIQFVVERDAYEDAIRALHECVIESVDDDQSIADLVRVA